MARFLFSFAVVFGFLMASSGAYYWIGGEAHTWRHAAALSVAQTLAGLGWLAGWYVWTSWEDEA